MARTRTDWQPNCGIKITQRVGSRMTIRETLEALRLHRWFAEDFFLRRSQSYGGRARVDYGSLVQTLLVTGSYTRTAARCGVTAERIRQLSVQAMRHLRELGKLPPLAVLMPEASPRADDKISGHAKHSGASGRVPTSRARSAPRSKASLDSGQIPLRELRQHPLRILARIAPSRTLEVLHRGRVIALLTKPAVHDGADPMRQSVQTNSATDSTAPGWFDELGDSREDVYTLDDGSPIDCPHHEPNVDAIADACKESVRRTRSRTKSSVSRSR